MENLSKIIESLCLEDVTSFLENESFKQAPEGVAEYLNLLDKIRMMLMRFDQYPNDDIIVNALVLMDNVTPVKARVLIAETRNFFWTDVRVKKEAWRNIYAEKLDKLISLTMLAVKDVKDGLAVAKIIKEARETRRLDVEDKEEIPFELLNQKRWVIYTSDITDLGMPKANRNELKALINSKTLELSDKEKQQMYREADILPFKAFPDEPEDARKH